jgi:uroporphyrinogen decarboxylase
MENLTAQERVIKTISHEEPDKVPSYEGSIDNLAICKHYKVKYGLLGAGQAYKTLYEMKFENSKQFNELMGEINAFKMGLPTTVKLYKRIGIDIVPAPIALFPKLFEQNGFVDEYGRINHFKLNPADNMDIVYYMGGAITNFDDFEDFPPLDPDDPRREEIHKEAKRLEEKFAENVHIAPMIFGMMEMTWEAFGLENFSRLLAQKENLKKVFDNRGSFAVELVKRLIEWGETGVVIICDDYGYKGGLFMSPLNYHKYVFPWLKRICDTAHKGGLKLMLHSCGDIEKIFEDIIKCGVDAINPIEPTTANPEYDIFKLNQKFGEKITFVGNVSPQDLSDKDPETIRNYTKKLLKEIAPQGGLILSSGHSINPAIKLENFLAMRETIDKFGKYPIHIN